MALAVVVVAKAVPRMALVPRTKLQVGAQLIGAPVVVVHAASSMVAARAQGHPRMRWLALVLSPLHQVHAMRRWPPPAMPRLVRPPLLLLLLLQPPPHPRHVRQRQATTWAALLPKPPTGSNSNATVKSMNAAGSVLQPSRSLQAMVCSRDSCMCVLLSLLRQPGAPK